MFSKSCEVVNSNNKIVKPYTKFLFVGGAPPPHPLCSTILLILHPRNGLSPTIYIYIYNIYILHSTLYSTPLGCWVFCVFLYVSVWYQIRVLAKNWALFRLFPVIDSWGWFWTGSLYKNIQVMLKFFMAPFFIMLFSCDTLIT